jgi:hypothetical protein
MRCRPRAQRLVERGEAFMGLAVGAVQVEEGAGQRGALEAVRRRSASGGGGVGEDRVGERLAHVGDQPFAVAGRQLGDVEAELLRQASTTPVETGRLLFSIWLR